MAFPFILRSTCNHLHWPQSQECVERAINVMIVSSQNADIKSFKMNPHMMSVNGGRGGGRGAGVAGAGSNCSQRPLNQKAKRL